MLINESALKHWIDHFYGYGSWDARLWFVANEEGGGDLPEDVADKLNYFINTHPSGEGAMLCDIRELYKHTAVRWDGPKASQFRDFNEFRFGPNAVLHGVWKNLISFVHGYRGVHLPDLLDYQKQEFVSSSQDSEALIRLYPLPAPHNHGWYYSWLDMPQFGFLKSRARYQETVFPNRIETILNNIATHKPDLVLMYAMSNINALKGAVQDCFHDARFSMVKASKQHTPQYHRAEINGTVLLITTQLPALRHGRIETGFDWYAFGESLRLGM
jgi:hypothetical protein